MNLDWNLIAIGITGTTWQVFMATWWAVVPVALFFIWRDFWLWGMNRLWKKDIKWVMLELKIPRNILKTPKAMEGIFSTLHAIYTSPKDGFEDRYFKGEDLSWFTCELVGYSGGVHFYIRCPKGSRNLVETAIYSEYPDAEVHEAEDYTELMPSILPNKTYDLFGNDFILAKDNPYPIKTYEFFEANVEEQRLDPISAITEVMSRLQEGEAIWLQYLVKPIPSDKLIAEGEVIRDKIMQRKKDVKKSFLDSLASGTYEFSGNLVKAARVYPQWADGAKKDEAMKMLHQSPGEKNVLEGVENKMSKLCFETAIRFIYIDKAESFTPANVAAVNGAFRQFNTQDMNSFKPLKATMTLVSSKKLSTQSWFRKQKLYIKKRKMYDMYRLRWFPPETSILNTEEMATIFHFPLVTVEAPMLRRLDTRKGEPPANIPFT